MGPEDKCFVTRNGRVRGVPSDAGGKVGSSGGLIGEQAGFFGGDDVFDDGHGSGGYRILGIALSDDNRAWSDFRDIQLPLTRKTPRDGGVEIPMHEEEAVVLALVNETAEACEQANVKTKLPS